MVLTRDQQRQRTTRRMMASAALELQLRQLVREVLGGNQTALVDFQQQIQYAPPEMKARILNLVSASPG